MKRYKAINFEYDDAYGTGTALDIVEHDEGEFVKYEDIRNLLENTSSNSDYAKLKDALESIADCGGCLTGEDAQEMKQIAIEALQ